MILVLVHWRNSNLFKSSLVFEIISWFSFVIIQLVNIAFGIFFIFDFPAAVFENYHSCFIIFTIFMSVAFIADFKFRIRPQINVLREYLNHRKEIEAMDESQLRGYLEGQNEGLMINNFEKQKRQDLVMKIKSITLPYVWQAQEYGSSPIRIGKHLNLGKNIYDYSFAISV